MSSDRIHPRQLLPPYGSWLKSLTEDLSSLASLCVFPGHPASPPLSVGVSWSRTSDILRRKVPGSPGPVQGSWVVTVTQCTVSNRDSLHSYGKKGVFLLYTFLSLHSNYISGGAIHLVMNSGNFFSNNWQKMTWGCNSLFGVRVWRNIFHHAQHWDWHWTWSVALTRV